MGNLDLAGLKAMLAGASLPWSRDKYGTLNSIDGRTVCINGVASVCSPGPSQDQAKQNAELVERSLAALPALIQRIEALEEAIEPFAVFADTFVDADGWNGPMRTTRIVDWFGPSDFRCARALFPPPNQRPLTMPALPKVNLRMKHTKEERHE